MQEVYDIIPALQADYPEGMTNANSWGREITRASLEAEGFSLRTRYPA